MYDLVIANGNVVDGTGAARVRADIAIANGVIERIDPSIDRGKARRVIDAMGKIVAPGVIDPHTHYDAQVHWDPYCTNSSWHGNTTVVVGNCGFGFMPCRPQDRERYMLMMENTEQVPMPAMREALPWTWESFPEWMAHMKRLHKGVNLAAYMPLNSLMMYVMGVEGAKTRRATVAERARMRDLLHEAMDAGAIGFGLSHLGEFNSHKDIDFSPMPSDTMFAEDAVFLAGVLRERGEGVIQCLAQLNSVNNSFLVEELARASGRPVVHNVINAVDSNPRYHLDIMSWLDRVHAEGLDIYSQALVQRGWVEFNVTYIDTLWQNVEPFTEFSLHVGPEAKAAIAKDEGFRQRARERYDPDMMFGAGGPVETHRLADAKGSRFAQFENMLVSEIAQATGSAPIDVLFDIVAETNAMADFRTTAAVSEDPVKLGEILDHDRVLLGTSDGGAHVKFSAGGQYATDMIMWMAREEQRISLERLHNLLSSKVADVFGFNDRGSLVEGKAADLYIYDFEHITYDRDRYEVLFDLPGNEFRRVCRAEGIDWVVVNGEPIFRSGRSTGAMPGRMITNSIHGAAFSEAAE
ncbi:amidohydrolase family protein [Sphingobium sp. HBC34]|uniref:Amidohydrolase family protein n=1 Tax=Sphingobium cyanobacteriorum TaxID=3063954 RepID=A0ABT8ZPJ0_9SPHN|nr:amidohydrolase family protein [Sphingobium sp. HBC34]MDO7836457.1 amidohydrolase family protein [Sphingobium sp. HBC34]